MMALQKLYPLKALAHKEMITVWRDNTFRAAAIVLSLLLLAAALTGIQQYRQEAQEREAAAQQFRQQWLQQHPKHPHIAAHFGNFAVMPLTALSLFDQGLNAYTGKVVYLEPHKQNEFSFKPSEEQDGTARFGGLSMALLLQWLFPLMIVFSCFNAFTAERESGNLKLLYSQGVSFTLLFTGKFAGRMVLVLLLLLPCILLLAGACLFIPAAQPMVARVLLLVLLYTGYLALCVALSLLISAHAGNGRTAVLSLLLLWMVSTILLPKWAASAGNNLYPLPDKYEFAAAIRADIIQGIDGHNPQNARALALKKQLLQQYGVDTISKLPFNFEGYVMQAGEEYSSKVYDVHFARLQHTLALQNRFTQWAGIINPYLAVHQLSMALCGTDYYNHLHFQQQAEAYRRYFVQQMNGDMKDHSVLGDWDYKASATVFNNVRPFNYTPPSVAVALRPYATGACSFLIWFIILLGVVSSGNHTKL